MITIYSTTHCHYCKMVKDYLTLRGFDFQEFNVQTDPMKAQEMIKKTGQMGVPVTDINGKLILGFNKKALDEALSIT